MSFASLIIAARRVRVWAGCMAALCGLSAVAAESDFRIEPDPTLLACLTSVRPDQKQPLYPEGQLPGTAAIVRVKLHFKAADAPPEVQVAFNNGTPAFASAVSEHVSNYRMPCLPAGRTLQGVQEFQFVVRAATPTVLQGRPMYSDSQISLPPECLAGIKGAPPPQFPSSNSVSGRVEPGVVVVRMTFRAADQPPEVRVLYDGGQRRLSRAVLASVAQYRLNCLKPGDPPLVATQPFAFSWQGEEPVTLPPELSLVQFLGVVKDMDSQRVRFDFTTMGCPFKVRVNPFQPYSHNLIHEVGDESPNPNRRDFIEWLRNITLDFPPKVAKTAIAQPTVVSVPCVLLDLT